MTRSRFTLVRPQGFSEYEECRWEVKLLENNLISHSVTVPKQDIAEML